MAAARAGGRPAGAVAFAKDTEASDADTESQPLRRLSARPLGCCGEAAHGRLRPGVIAGVAAALAAGFVVLAGASGSLGRFGHTVSADRVFSMDGRKVCTTVPGKHVMGKPLDQLSAQHAYGCRYDCEVNSTCGCYAFDPDEKSGCQTYYSESCGGFVSADSFKGVSGECSTCPFCSPEGLRSRPWVVIPFYHRDLCKMKILASSLTKHDPNHELGDVVLLWLDSDTPGKYQDDINVIIGYTQEGHGVHFHDFSWAMHAGLKGWELQQVMKLKAAMLVDAEFYVVLDAKNAFIRDVQPDTFLSPCNQGLVFAQWTIGEQGDEKFSWFDHAAKDLGVGLPSGKMSGSITPCVMHTKTVLNMFEHLSEAKTVLKVCEGPLCGYIQRGATEFALYYTYVRQLADEKCIHNAVDHHPAVSLWNGVDVNARVGAVDGAANDERIIMFGAQPGTLQGLGTDDYYRLAYKMEEIYGKAGLHDSKTNSVESLVACVAPDA